MRERTMLVLAIVLGALLLMFCSPAKSAEIPLSLGVNEPKCEEAQKDRETAVERIEFLREVREKQTDTSRRLVLAAEIVGVLKLKDSIDLWINENCKEA